MKLSQLFTLVPLLWGAAAYADPNWITCRTDSNGYPFEYASRDARYSEEQAIRGCQSHPATDNRECQININCDDGRYNAPVLSCDTISRGRTFRYSSRDVSFSREKALAKCKSDPSTDNRECEVNLRCDTAIPPTTGRDLFQYLDGTFQATNCPNCFLQVTRYGRDIYGDMMPWQTSRSYSGGPQIISITGVDTFVYRGDHYRLRLSPSTRPSRGILTMDRLTRNAPNVESASREVILTPTIPACPGGQVWDPARSRCVPVVITPPTPSCPPGTVWDARLQRCVSVVTPPRPVPPRPVPPRPVPPPPVRNWTCSIHTFRATGPDLEATRQQVLNTCARSSSGYVCRASDVVCNQ